MFGILFFAPSAHATSLELYSTPLFGDSGLASYYRMEGNATDAKGSNNGSDPNVTFASSSGMFGEYGIFDGSSSYTGMGNVFDNDGTGMFSISAWVKTSAGGATVYSIASKQIMTYPYTGWQFGLNIKDATTGNAGKLGFQIYDGATGVAIQSAGTYNDGNWHFVVATYNGTKTVSGIKLYVDGMLLTGITSYLQSSMSGSSSNSADFQVGSRNGAQQIWNGDLDDVAMWMGVLNVGEIIALYDGTPYFSSSNQYKSDATTTIGEGGATTENMVTFGANIYSIATSTVKLEVEVQPSGADFTDTATSTSGLVTSGSIATTSYALPPKESSDGDYHWQARAVDADGNYSPWQPFISSASTTVNFTINTVPLYTQKASPYPNPTDSAIWASSTYDNATPGTQCPSTGGGSASSTIAACGCAITSVVMDLRYFGVTTNVSGTDVNPVTLNDWLIADDNYDSEGDIIRWDDFPLYAEQSGQFTVSSTIIEESGSPATLSSTTQAYIY